MFSALKKLPLFLATARLSLLPLISVQARMEELSQVKMLP